MLDRILHSRRLTLALALFLIASGFLAILVGIGPFLSEAWLPAGADPPSRPGERLIPTATAQGEPTLAPSPLLGRTETAIGPTSTPSMGITPSATTMPTPRPSSSAPKDTAVPPAPTATAPAATSTVQPPPAGQAKTSLFSPRQRIGVVAPLSDVDGYDAARLGAGWYLPGGTYENLPGPEGMEGAQLVVVSGNTFRPDAQVLQEVARSNPGALWLVGNEPDVIWQSNATPQEYAQVYHDVYQVLKGVDPTCQVAIGGISQVTPLRLRYLEAVLAAYEAAVGRPMPVDVWNIHVAILREERGSWGVDIPPGLPDDAGILYEIQDNADIEILKAQTITFRRWMAERGLRDKPLIVTEFSVLMPPEYGFPFERVRDFMLASTEFLMTATDDQVGHPADGNRLVQRWAWYSIADDVYATGNLFDPGTGEMTPLGNAFAEHVAGW